MSILSGYVHVYEFIDNTWTQISDDIDGEAYDYYNSGIRVSLSGDGSNVMEMAILMLDMYAFPSWVAGSSTAWNQVGCDIEDDAVGDES